MIAKKNAEDLLSLREAGKILASVLAQTAAAAKPGVTTRALDQLAERLIRQAGALPAFLGYRPSQAGTAYPATLCTSVNNEVVHAPPSDRVLKEGDIVGLDLGLYIQPRDRPLYVDAALTVGIGRISRTARRLITAAREALEEGILVVCPGNHITDISRAVQRRVAAAGYAVVRQLVGHGVGYAVHEEPQVPNYLDPGFSDLPLEPGLVIAIEPMVNTGDWRVKTLGDGWTIVTADGSLSAHFEHTVAVTATGHEILTLP